MAAQRYPHLFLKFEDLRAHPCEGLRKMVEFLHVEVNEQRLQEANTESLVEAAEQLSGRYLPEDKKRALFVPPDEHSLVVSGLEQKMTEAYDEIRQVLLTRRGIRDIRTAAYVVAIRRVAQAYMELGVFP